MEINKTKSKTKKTNNSLSNIGSSLRESLKGFTSIKDNSNKFEEENNTSLMDNDKKQTSITSIIKTPSFKTVTQSPIESVKQVSETTSSFLNITSISIFLLIFFVLGFFGYIIYDYLLEQGKNINNLIAPISNFFTQFTENNVEKDSEENKKSDEKTDEKSNEKIIKDVENKKNVKTLETTVKNKKSLKPENSKKLITNEEPEPIRTDSLSSGYCYIGKVNDTRYCTKVDARSKCMSGDIYPTMEICVNPNLRA